MHRAVLTTAVVALVPALLGVGGCGGHPGGGSATVHTYVALGDSFTSGAGLAEPSDQACQRSRLNYPSLVARALAARLTDASCGGATTDNLTHPQVIGSVSEPPQLDAVSRSTDLVTIGLGYNDQVWFGGLFADCVAAAASDPNGHPCQDAARPDRSQVAHAIGDAVAAALSAVEQKAPDARVLLVGYPQLVPASGTCPELPFAAGDYAYVRGQMELLDGELKRAAHAAGATYVDVLAASAGHDICAGDDAWVNGVAPQPGTGAGFHPLPRGHRAVADLVLEAVRS